RLTRMFDTGPLAKARETLRVFASAAPSAGELLANRRSRFDRAHAVLPSTATTGESLDLLVQAWDQCERLFPFEGTFRVTTTDPDAAAPDRVRFEAADDGLTTAGDVAFHTPGVHYLVLERVGTGERFVANPVRVHADEPDRRVYWGDIHLHSTLSDGTGRVEEGLRFARDVMALDVAAYTDHDTMGFFIPPSLQRRRMHGRYFARTKRATAAFHDPGEFVTLFGYEWTQQPNVGGHLNVYFDTVEGAELFDSRSPETDTYEKLWARLREWRADGEGDVLTVPHHTAEAMYPFDFDATEYDDGMAPLVEVYSQWGSSERPGRDGNRYPLAMGQGEVGEDGHYARDALAMGHRVGLMASSDYHGPAPGHSLIHARPHFPSLGEWLDGGLGWGNVWRIWAEQSYPGGLVAFRAPELTREAVFDALRSRRVYGTSQPHRVLVDLRVDGVAVGESDSEVTLSAPDAAREVAVSVAGTNPVERATVLKNGEAWRAVEGTDDPDAGLDAYVVERSWTDDAPVTGMEWDDERGSDADVYYLRVHQAGGGSAWAGPLWVGT
ncbi:MAG: DUF3604 domain-containing protein, partial [Haloferacaceae archaeon]